MKGRVIFGILVVLLCSLPSAYALSFLQQTTDITDTYDYEQTIVITILNDEPEVKNILITVSPQSYYLSEYITIENDRITLSSGEKRNILVKTNFPSNLSPETHELILIAQDDEKKSTAKTIISFDIDGIASPAFTLSNQHTEQKDKEIIITTTLANEGNVIIRTTPHIQVNKDSTNIKSIDYKQPIVILPGKSYPLTLRLETTTLKPDTYNIFAEFTSLNTPPVQTDPFETTVESTSSKSTKTVPISNYVVTTILVLAVLTVIGMNIFSKKKDEYSHLLKRQKKAEIEIKKLLIQTNTFINDANKWISTHKGKNHELR